VAFADPAHRALFASEHTRSRPGSHDEFLKRKRDFDTKQMSLGDNAMFDYESMTEPEKKDDKKEPEKKGEEPKEKKGDGPGGGAPKAQEHKFKNLLSKLEKFGTKLDPEKIKSAEDLCHELETVLHAMEDHMESGTVDAGIAPGNGAPGKNAEAPPPALVPEAPGGGAQYSLAQAQKDIQALQLSLTSRDRENAALSSVANKQQFSLIKADLGKWQLEGCCTKADVDDWLARIEAEMGKSRFSVLAPHESPVMLAIFAEIKQMKKTPKGTFGKPEGARAPVLVPEAETPEQRAQRLSLAPEEGNKEEVLARSRAYFEREIWPSLGIAPSNGTGK
jgi:hypothetical protein